MTGLKPIKRVTIYAEGSLEEHVVELCTISGARGYTVLDCRAGKGVKTPVEGKFFNAPARVRIDVVADQDVAEKIMTHLNGEAYLQRPILAVIENVEIGEKVAY